MRAGALEDPRLLSAWVNLDRFRSGAGVIHKGNEGSREDEAYSLMVASKRVKLQLVGENGKTITLTSKKKLAKGTWYQITATWDESGRKIYINGEENVSSKKTTTVRKTSDDVNIGARFDESAHKKRGNYGIQGTVDEAAIHDRALTEDEILSYYQETR